MTPEEKSLLEQTHKMTVENNEILKSLNRSRKVAFWFRVSYWVVIIVLTVGSYFAAQTFIKMFLEASPKQAQQNASSAQGLLDMIKSSIQ